MERHLAIVEQGVVVNVVVVDLNDTATIAHFGGLLLPVDSQVGIGWSYDGTNFAAPPAPIKTFAEIEAGFISAVSAHLNAAVQGRGYDSMLSCSSYAASTNTTFKAEALAAITWRDAVWLYCYAQLAAVQAGTRSIPASTEAFIAELPVLVW